MKIALSVAPARGYLYANSRAREWLAELIPRAARQAGSLSRAIRFA